jgi:hypothetical protein
MPAKRPSSRRQAARHVLGSAWDTYAPSHRPGWGRRSPAGRPRATCGCPGCANLPRAARRRCAPPGCVSFRKRDTPVMVPVVPIALTKCVTRPAVSPRSRGRWSRSAPRGLSALANWSSTRPLPSRLHLSARSRAYSMPPDLGDVSTSSAPKAFIVWRALDRQVLGHDQHHAVAADRRRHGQRDAGVARRGLDQRVARLDVAALLGARGSC